METSFLGETTAKPGADISQNQVRVFFNSAGRNLNVKQAFPNGRLAMPTQYNVTNIVVVSPAFILNRVCQPCYLPSFHYLLNWWAFQTQ